MTTLLLDANALIALTVADHVHHARVEQWFGHTQRVALCPIVEGSLMRYLVRVGVPATSVTALLEALYEDPRIEFWPDDIRYSSVGVHHVIGHRQVTDSYLAALAVHHGAKLATLDAGLAAALPDAVVLIPQ